MTGSRELAGRGARVAAVADGHIEWPPEGVRDGDDLHFGRWRLQATAITRAHRGARLLPATGGRPGAGGAHRRVTPCRRGGTNGPHRPGRHRGAHTSTGRPVEPALYRSINHRLLALHDDVLVLPTHGGGSFCSAAGGARRWTTIGDERRSNPLLAIEDEDAFVREVIAGFSSYPPYFYRMREVNRRGPAVHGTFAGLRSLTAEQVHDLRDQRANVLDARSVADYAAGHVRGSLANSLRPQFGLCLGWLVENPNTPLIFVTDEHTDRRGLVRQCLNAGYEQLAGEITFEAWQREGGEILSTPLVGADQLTNVGVLDVRQDLEFASGHPRAEHVELDALPNHAGSLDGPFVVMCRHGERAAAGASVLESATATALASSGAGAGDRAAATGEELDVRS